MQKIISPNFFKKSFCNYFKDLITGKSGHNVDFLRGVPYDDLQLSNEDYLIREFYACDESGIVYAYFKNRGNHGNFMLLPDYSSANIDIIKHVLAKLSSLSPKGLFNKDYQEHGLKVNNISLQMN